MEQTEKTGRLISPPAAKVSRPRRITLVIFSLVAGGAERVIATMANYWAEEGLTIFLLTIAGATPAPFYPLHAAVHFRPLDLAGMSTSPFNAILNNWRRLLGLRRAIRETAPDTVISLMSETNVLTLLATRGLGVPVLVQEQNDPAEHAIGRSWDLLRRWTYPRAERVVVLSKRAIDYFPPSIRERACVIPNPAIIVSPSTGDPTPRREGRALIAMGRFVPQKGFDLLIDAYARIAARHPEWTLEILGDGPLRPQLEAQIAAAGLADRVRLPGITKTPHDRLRQADLFVMSSRHEGFPLSLCEALGCGLPAVSFDCPTGPADIIRHEVDGLLVPPADPAALAMALDRLMGDAAQRHAFASRAPEVLDRYSVDRIMNLWEQLLPTPRP